MTDTFDRLKTALADRYAIERELGAGGMATVYLAEDLKHHRKVAVKVLRPELAAVLGAERFVQEIKTTANLQHPHILPLFDSGEADSFLYYVMPFIDGETLRDKLNRETQLGIEEAVKITTEVADALDYAHRHNVIHRDIKPENILLQESAPLVADFGIALALSRVASERITQTGLSLGTPSYMSPEQATGDRDLDARSDVYALGSVLYEMLAGDPPFIGSNVQAVIAKVIGERPVRLRTIRDTVPAHIEAAIDKALAKVPGDRFRSAKEFAEALVSETAVAPVEAAPAPSTAASAWRSRFGYAVPVGAVAVLVWALLARGGDSSLPAQQHLAVLPFTMAEADLAEQALSDGLVETLRSRLTQLERFEEALWVVPAEDMRAYQVTSPAEAQQWLGANLALSGHVERVDDLIRLTLTLVDAKAQRELQSQTVEGRQADISTLQKDVFTTVADLLDLDLPSQAQPVSTAGGTTVPGANVFYLRGRGYLEDIDKVDVAIQSFELALQEDSAFALAYVGLGEAYLRKYDVSRDAQWLEAAEMYCDRAIELSDELAEVYVTLGQVHTETGRYGMARFMFREALTRNPISAAAHRRLAGIYEKLGDLEEAEATYKKSIALKRGYWVGYNALGVFYFREGRYSEAAEQFQWVIDLTPDNPMGYNNLGAVSNRLGRLQDAFQLYLRSVEVQPTELASRNLGGIYYNEKKFTEAAQMFEKAVRLEELKYVNWGRLANAYHWAGQHEKARTAWQRMIDLAEAQRAVNPRDSGVLGALAGAYAKLGGHEQQARTMIERLLGLKRLVKDDLTGIARTFEIMDERDLALQYFERALELGASPSAMERSPWMQDLRADPRYKKMTEPYLEMRE